MKDYPKKSKKRRIKPTREVFDPSLLTAFDRVLLQAFEERRQNIQEKMETSTILYPQKICPGCGYPTFDTDHLWGTCVLCLWEGWSGDQNPTYQGPPNYLSLLEHRVNISYSLRLLEEKYYIDPSIEAIIQSIEQFKKEGTAIDIDNFEHHAKRVLPVRTK